MAILGRFDEVVAILGRFDEVHLLWQLLLVISSAPSDIPPIIIPYIIIYIHERQDSLVKGVSHIHHNNFSSF